MATISKKDKLIEEAQKFALRGQFDKAAKAYEQILAADPAAISQRQKLAELLIKCGRSDDARKEFEIIGRHFAKNGFYLKAIAVYKQLQKLFPADISLSLTLAELNEKHGLIANSLSEYKLVYEYHEKNGNTPEALDILDRMQKVDPQNIPIKIKLAEAYAQHGKKNEAYDVFAKTAALLLERADNATLAKVCARIQQLFPGKPDFLLEVLSEQISHGSAATAVGSLQSILRNNPGNKSAWDLIVKTYQQLEQPQRLKIAYQHYLNYFPTEPAAMLGVISSIVAEKNLAGALELLDQYESTLISAGVLPQLEEIYHSLDKIDPINMRVLEGLIRIATASCNETEISLLTSKQQSLRSVSGKSRPTTTEPETLNVFTAEHPLAADEIDDSIFFGESSFEQPTGLGLGTTEDEQQSAPLPDGAHATATATTPWQPDEEIEIDIDIDMDSPFGPMGEEESTSSDPDNWLESVGELFDTISTAPRVVKFGSEMDGSDAQSHFDLGQAFKEMGLYDEAINEFRQASQDTSRRIECLIMQCACLRERGDVEKAITMLLALLKPGLSAEESCAVKYELASGYEAAGKQEEATTILNEISKTNPAFRDIQSRLNAAAHPDSLDFSDEDLQDF
ncbi:MAG: tetratricopeptide repeat protein [Desulfuromonadaceae bacterium]